MQSDINYRKLNDSGKSYVCSSTFNYNLNNIRFDHINTIACYLVLCCQVLCLYRLPPGAVLPGALSVSPATWCCVARCLVCKQNTRSIFPINKVIHRPRKMKCWQDHLRLVTSSVIRKRFCQWAIFIFFLIFGHFQLAISLHSTETLMGHV